MGRIYKQPGSVNWYISYYLDGVEKRFSSGTADEAQARAQLALHETLITARNSNVNLHELCATLTGKSIPTVSLKAEMDAWLREVERSASSQTHSRYASVAHSLLSSLKATAHSPLLSEITTTILRDHLDKRFAETSASNANYLRKVLRIFFRRVSTGDNPILRSNPILPIKPYRSTAPVTKRRPFTVDELSMIYQHANPFWQYMLIGGVYTGLRMGDLATLQIEDIDFEKNILCRGMNKRNGKIVKVPLVLVFVQTVRQQIGERSKGPVWPAECALYRRRGPSPFSQQFYNLLASLPTPLVPPRSHRKVRNGRHSTHQTNEISFHCTRHSCISFMKRAGVSQGAAKEIAGHTNDAINDLYTTMGIEALTDAVNRIHETVKAFHEPARITGESP